MYKKKQFLFFHLSFFFFFFFFEFELHSVQPWWFALYKWRAEKGWLVTYLTRLPHIPASFMTSLIQSSRHKMAVCTVVFSLISSAFFFSFFFFFYKQDQKSSEKLDTVSQFFFVCFFACMLILLLLFSFLSTRPMLLLRLVSPLTFRAVCPVVTSNAVTPSHLQRRAERQELWLSGLVRCAGCKWLR